MRMGEALAEVFIQGAAPPFAAIYDKKALRLRPKPLRGKHPDGAFLGSLGAVQFYLSFSRADPAAVAARKKCGITW